MTAQILTFRPRAQLRANDTPEQRVRIALFDGPLSLDDLTEETGLDLPTVRDAATRLEEMGHVETVAKDDPRLILLEDGLFHLEATKAV